MVLHGQATAEAGIGPPGDGGPSRGPIVVNGRELTAAEIDTIDVALRTLDPKQRAVALKAIGAPWGACSVCSQPVPPPPSGREHDVCSDACGRVKRARRERSRRTVQGFLAAGIRPRTRRWRPGAD